MNYILFDDLSWNNLLPLTFTRPVADIRIGILTIKEKWEKILEKPCSYLTQQYLSEKYKIKIEDDNILINASIIPNINLIDEIVNLKKSNAIIKDEKLVAIRLSDEEIVQLPFSKIENFFVAEKEYEIINTKIEFLQINFPWDIFKNNGDALCSDFELITKNRKSSAISKTNNILARENIFIEEGARIEYVTINAENGPIYIGKNAEIMEGSVIRGPFALCEESVLKMSAKVYGPTTIGPYSKIGGEINNVVIFGYSNKAHDGFLGNAVIGEWCNIGADSNNSNLKNNYAEVKMWNYGKEKFIKTGLQFCGLIMGDHSKCGINTMFNTGTIVGVSANIYGSGFPRNFIPSFSWGGALGFSEYAINKAVEVAENVMKRRNKDFDETEKKILTHIFNITEKYRKFSTKK